MKSIPRMKTYFLEFGSLKEICTVIWGTFTNLLWVSWHLQRREGAMAQLRKFVNDFGS